MNSARGVEKKKKNAGRENTNPNAHIVHISHTVCVLWDPRIIRARNEDAYRSCTRYFLLSMCPEREREREL